MTYVATRNKTMMDADLLFCNFAGRYNAAGDRNFSVIVPDELVNEFRAEGLNVKDYETKGGLTIHHLNIKVSYKVKEPRAFLIINNKVTTLDQDTIGAIDDAYNDGTITSVKLRFHPSYYDKNGKSGYSCYLEQIYVTVEDELANMAMPSDKIEIPESATSEDDLPF